MNHAAKARANAIQIEVKKDGLSQKQSGDWSLRLTLKATEPDVDRLIDARMGTRFACVLVEVNDDETPVDHKAMERDKWRDLGPAKQAGIRCKEPMFWAFLREYMHYACEGEDDAATAVRDHCKIDSRSELSKPGRSNARIQWYALDNAYQGWKVAEHA